MVLEDVVLAGGSQNALGLSRTCLCSDLRRARPELREASCFASVLFGQTPNVGTYGVSYNGSRGEDISLIQI